MPPEPITREDKVIQANVVHLSNEQGTVATTRTIVNFDAKERNDLIMGIWRVISEYTRSMKLNTDTYSHLKWDDFPPIICSLNSCLQLKIHVLLYRDQQLAQALQTLLVKQPIGESSEYDLDSHT